MVQVQNEPGTYGSGARLFAAGAEAVRGARCPRSSLRALEQARRHLAGGVRQGCGRVLPRVVGCELHRSSRRCGQGGVSRCRCMRTPRFAIPSTRASPGDTRAAGRRTTCSTSTGRRPRRIDFARAGHLHAATTRKYTRVLELYRRPDNALFVAETGNDVHYARYLFTALGQQAIGFTPFGIGYSPLRQLPAGREGGQSGDARAVRRNYRLLAPMARKLAALSFEGKVWGVSENPKEPHGRSSFHRVARDDRVWSGAVRSGAAHRQSQPSGGALIAQLAPNEFLVTGFNVRVLRCSRRVSLASTWRVWRRASTPNASGRSAACGTAIRSIGA